MALPRWIENFHYFSLFTLEITGNLPEGRQDLKVSGNQRKRSELC
jgi:hypothetical protein